MQFLSSICSDHHDNFHALLGVQPVQKKKVAIRKKRTKKQTLTAQRPRYKLPTNRTKRKLSISQKKEQQTAVKQEENEIQEAKMEEIMEDTNLQENFEETTEKEENQESQNMNSNRAQKNFFHIVINQTASNLKRFLRTNASQIHINETIMDKKLAKPNGPFCGWGAIHIAAFRGDIEMISLLIDHGAEINLKASLQSEVS